ncbi:hypothetical protein [Aliiglaciecola lipolytica]|uniref:Uncharacterized protein n=1 Tax=Aliiglaciecola lipolytica E3 TaxID=1127673 RepID=K6YRJ5_9ALTE|nr:hypothetical protein [Aliiglaciecola lipolytica]GAC13940.1 hypothetical protein GLIP_1299 [Aliiglaciecola lipolytica E3]
MLKIRHLFSLCVICSTLSVVNFSYAETKLIGCSLEVSKVVGFGFDSGSKAFIKSGSDSIAADIKAYFSDNGNQNELLASSLVGGTAATTVGFAATYFVSTPVVTAATVAGAEIAFGTAVGATFGAISGSTVGLASGGTAIAATVPFAKYGALLGASLGGNLASISAEYLASISGEYLATLGVAGSSPGWAGPVAIGGAVVIAVSGGFLIYNLTQDDNNLVATGNLICVE